MKLHLPPSLRCALLTCFAAWNPAFAAEALTLSDVAIASLICEDSLSPCAVAIPMPLQASADNTYTHSGQTVHLNADLAWVGYDSVLFASNNTTAGYYASDSCGGAIYTSSADVTVLFDDNGSVTFRENTAEQGGVIYQKFGALAFLDNDAVTFESNYITSTSNYVEGACIYGWYRNNIEFSGNGSVAFNENKVIQTGTNIAAEAHGGAIVMAPGCGGYELSFRNNGSVSFCGNVAESQPFNASGGALFVSQADLNLCDNGTVVFRDNVVRTSAANFGASGGAVSFLNNDFTISGNESVLFQGNVEVNVASYRLRSLWGWHVGLHLSADKGQTITFRDSVYVTQASITLNEGGAGDVIFSGATTVADLNAAIAADGLERTATDEEILNSRTSEFHGTTTLCGGRLCLEDGAVWVSQNFNFAEGANATLVLRDAAMDTSPTNSVIVMTAGSHIVTSGASSISCYSLTLTEAISNSGTLTLSGRLYVSDLASEVRDCLVDLNGCAATSGFAGKRYTVQVVDGGTVICNGVSVGHNSIYNLTLDSDGYARAAYAINDQTNYSAYYLNSGDTATLSAIKNKAGSALTSVCMSGGTLTVDADDGGVVQASGGAIALSGGSIVGSISGNTTVTVTGASAIVGENSYTGGTLLQDAAFGVGGAMALGQGPISVTGTSALVNAGKAALNLFAPISISDDSTLVIQGSFDVSGLISQATGTISLVDLKNVTGGESGFVKLTDGALQVFQGGSVITEEETHFYFDGKECTMRSDGSVALGEITDYGTYFLGEGGSAALSAIRAKAGSELTSVSVRGGALTVDGSDNGIVTSTAGTVRLTSGTLSGSIGGTTRVETAGDVCISGSNAYTGGTVISGGTLSISSKDSLGSGAITLNGGTLNLGGCAVTNNLTVTGGAISGGGAYNGALTLSGQVSLDGAMQVQSCTIANDTCLTLSNLTKGTATIISAGTLSADVTRITVSGLSADDYTLSTSGNALKITVTHLPVAWSLCQAAGSVQQHGHITTGNLRLTDDYYVSAPLIWDAAKGKGSFALSGKHSLVGSEFTISGGAYNEKKATFGTGKGGFSIAEDVELDFDTITATAGATVTIEAPLSDTEVGVSSNAKLTLGGESDNVGYTFNGGQIIRPESELSDITLKIDSKTAQNLYVGNLTLTDGANVTVSYTGKNTKPMLAVQGILTLEGGVNVAISTSGATKAVAAHDFVLFQCLGFDGELSSLTLTQKPWSGKLVSAVVNGSYIVAYVQNTAKQKYTKPKALSGNYITFLSRDASKVFTDTDLIISEDTTRNLTWGSTKGKGTFTMSGEGTLSGDTLSFSGGWDAKKGMAKAGKAVYNVETALDYKRIEAVQGATVHLAHPVNAGTTLAVAAGSTKTTLLDVGSASGVTLNYSGGTIRGNISATGMTATFDKTVKQQNLLDGNLTLSGALVVQAAATKITRPVLAVTGTLTLDDVTITITGDAKQSDFVLFQSRGMLGEVPSQMTFNGETRALKSYTSGGYNMLAYVTKKSGPKPIKLAACSVTQSAESAADTSLICGEAGGSLLETQELAGGDYAEVLVQSGIAELAEGEVLTAPVISVGTGADEFNATLNNSGTLQGAVEITKNASIDNQGTIIGDVSNAGTLNNDGSISGAVTVASGATLSGSGSISALTLADGAILSSTGDTMTVGSLTLGGETVVSLYLEGVSGAVSRELLKADSVSGEGTWSLTLSGVSMEDAELVWEDGVLTFKGTAAEQQTLVAAPATTPDTRVPQLLANSLWAVTETTKSFVNNALRQYRDRAAGKTTAYASALGSFVNMSGFTANGGGGAVGVEHNVAEGAALGLSLGYTDSKLKGDGAAIDQDSTHAAVYTDIRRGAWGLQAYAAYGNTENKLRGSRAEFDTDDYAAGATTSWSIGCVSLFSGLRYAAARADVADGHMQAWQLPVGATVSKQYGKLITSATAAYVGDLARQNPRVKVAGESIRGANPGRSGFELNLGATYLFSDSWSASANYALETRARATSQSVNASVRYSF